MRRVVPVSVTYGCEPPPVVRVLGYSETEVRGVTRSCYPYLDRCWTSRVGPSEPVELLDYPVTADR